MSTPITIQVPHRLGKDEALRRLKAGITRAHGQFGAVMSFERAEWSGDTLDFAMRALGQSASGTIAVAEDHLAITVTLPWLLAKAAERLMPAMREQAKLLLEKK
jgi:hypothetical protein